MNDLNVEVRRNLKPQPDAEVAVLETDFGKIVIELYPNVAPQMVERFKTLVRAGFYDGTTFHRINPRLGIIQGGDPLSKDGDPENDGTGRSDYPDLPAEFSDLPYARGIVGAARSSAPHTANSQFFVTLIQQSAFNEKYTVFGRVIEGIDTAGVISNAAVQPGTERPADPIYLKRATLQPHPGAAKTAGRRRQLHRPADKPGTKKRGRHELTRAALFFGPVSQTKN